MTIGVRGEISDLLIFGRNAPHGDIKAADIDDQLTLDSHIKIAGIWGTCDNYKYLN